jgi:nicotinamidase-related amidase
MPAKKALLVIDAQVGLFHLSKPLHRSDIVLSNIQMLIDDARTASIPIIYLQHSGSQNGIFAAGSPGWKIHPSISPRQGDLVVEKQKADAFCQTVLLQRLNELTVETLVVCGFVTEGCVDTTVRRASSLGFKIELVSDAHSTTDGEVLLASQIVDHHNSVLAIFAEVKKANEIHFDR